MQLKIEALDYFDSQSWVNIFGKPSSIGTGCVGALYMRYTSFLDTLFIKRIQARNGSAYLNVSFLNSAVSIW